MEAGLAAYHRKLKLAVFFEREEREAREPINTSSGWEPKRSQVSELVWKIVEEDERVVKGVREVELV